MCHLLRAELRDAYILTSCFRSLQQLRTFGSYHSHLPSLFHEQEKDQLLVKKNGPLSQHCTESSHDSSGNSHTSAVSANTHTPDTLGLAAASSMQVNPVQSISGTDSQSGQQVCRLCENIVSVKMEPCGHAVLCHICARRATKCLHCRVRKSQKLIYEIGVCTYFHWLAIQI